MNGKKLMHLLGLVEMRVPGQRSWEGWALSKKTVGKRLFFLPRKIITFHCDCRYSTISTFIFSFQKIFLRSPRTWLESSGGSQFSPCVGVCECLGGKKESNWFSFNNILTHLPFEKERGRESHGRRFLNLRNKVSAALAEAPGMKPPFILHPQSPAHLLWMLLGSHSYHFFPPVSPTREARFLVPVDHVEVFLRPVLPESWRARTVETAKQHPAFAYSTYSYPLFKPDPSPSQIRLVHSPCSLAAIKPQALLPFR